MTTVNQQGPILYVNNQTINSTTSISVNSSQVCNMSSTGISNTYRIPSGLTANPSNNINQIGCVIYTEGIRANVASSSSPYNMTNTGTLPIGSYILLGYLSIGPQNAVAMTVTKAGIFFDTSSGVVDSETNGTPYFASANIITGTNVYGIPGATGNGVRLTNTMIVNLTTPTIIYLNGYNQYSGTTNISGNWALQITRIG
jgi:hypothetical protein